MAAKVKALQGWCKVQCDGYRDVEVKNMTSSWKSGLAFCAMIHRYRPDLIDYDSLKKENVFENNKLAFEVAEKQLNIPALLDAEDMEAMAVPDKLCIVTYVSQYYNCFRNKEKLGGPGVTGKVAPKRQMIDSSSTGTPDNKKPHTQPGLLTAESPASSPTSPPVRRGSSMGDLCTICQGKVYIMERHIEGTKLFHRRCLRESQRSKRTINQNGAISPRQKRAFKGSDQRTSTPNQNARMEEDSGKENKKPMVGNGVKSPTTPTSNGLLSKVHGAPKPYTSIIQNDKDQSKDAAEKSKWMPGSSSHSKYNINSNSTPFSAPNSGSAEPTRKYVQNKGAARDDAKKDFFHGILNSKPTDKQPQSQPMDTSCDRAGRKYDIVGALVNNNNTTAMEKTSTAQPQFVSSKTFTNDSSNRGGAKLDSKATTEGDTTGDTQVLHGLLKSLAGVRGPIKPLPVTAATSGGGPSKKAEGWNQKVDSDTQWSGQKESTTFTSQVDPKDDYTTARSRLKPAQTPQPEAEQKDSKTSKLTPTTKQSDTTTSKLTPTTKQSDTTTRTSVSSVKPIIQQTTDTPVIDSKVKPKSILKSLVDSENEDPSTRSRSVSPPKSILKYTDDGRKAGERAQTKKKSPSPTRPILKHMEESKDKDYYKSPPRSILRGKPEESSAPASKAILKKSHDFDEKEDKMTTQKTPRSILKKSTEDLSKLTTEETKDVNTTVNTTTTKTVLRGKEDSSATAVKDDSRKSWGSKFTDLFSRPSPEGEKKNKNTDLLSHVELDSSDTEEPMDVESSHVTRPVPKPRKSILKMGDVPAESPRSTDGGKTATNKNSSWYKDIPTPEQSSHSPASSTVFSASSTTSSANRNNFSAFNVADSIELVVDMKSPDSESKGQGKKQTPSSANKSAWQIEMEARQGIRQKEPKTSPGNFATKVEAAHKQKQQQEAQRGGGFSKSPGNNGSESSKSKPAWQVEAKARQKNWKTVEERETGKASNSPRGGGGSGSESSTGGVTQPAVTSNKPAWQIEAERRQAERKGEYKDPEKFPHHNKEPQVFPRLEKKDEKNTTTNKLSLNIDKKPLSPRSPRSPPPPRPVVPPNHHQVSPPLPTAPPRLSSSSKSPVTGSNTTKTTITMPPAPDFVNSEVDIFGRTSKGEGGVGKKVNRSAAFKVSPESSPVSGAGTTSRDREAGSPEEAEEVVMTEWQREAHKRQAARAGGGFVDPETKKIIVSPPVKSFDEDEYYIVDAPETPTDSVQHRPTVIMNKKKVVPDTRFSFTELNYSTDASDKLDRSSSPRISQDSTSSSPKPSPPVRPPWVGRGFQGRPLPSPPTNVIKREVNAEPHMAQEAITTELLSIDVTLREMEEGGKTLEQKIRMGSEEDMDEDELMVQWFELVNEKNDLVRRETELMYKQKQQELEDRHAEVEYEIRMLMNTPEHQKTPSDKVREETLLQELMETVSQRNSIVDSMEEDRIRYIEEDQEIAEVLATKDFRSGSFSKSSPPVIVPVETETPKKEKKKKGKKGRKKGKAEEGSNKPTNGLVQGEGVTGSGDKIGESREGKKSGKKKKKQKDRRLTGCLESSTEWYE